ncbi:hypothetical protein COV53_02000 [Candidatus Gottesmanbacteria bacterium CG11_big_fil_rev_8_21_14_0_20_37_11]|uniref:DUF202 domain-containing protein n=2 Tax=Candidatus Gottesmaniibacteriota TaxID=1752720 RepID=A0A1J4TP19_9BACT|nr:MAG: hypothetical protein AUJ73_03810 [Candidatus Gottesmanbacteria bacterium CG1_02_37_22]PIP32317.1 MAG: hypothetical protein COX23_05415 [Candidatus Gottesmanbacteria bacterium CG23_combo_of_CG06-09_8_20_14_all_37_19]PIR08634.1 MAG: hypothetical protein COV53_02000 [Candidatus Gottesmanbacteria bacterium CG11_big_fil_rev_8_21_14_0_20_37_11]
MKKITVRDHLAFDRTNLANERTFLAYIRTALTLFVSGVSFIQFFTTTIIVIIGWLFIPIGILILIKGINIYINRKGGLSRIENGKKYSTDK